MKNIKTRILGIDPGYAILGYGVLDCERRGRNESIALEDCGIVQTAPHTPFADRLNELHDDVLQLLRETSPDVIAIEKFFFYRMANTLQVAQARGAVLMAIARSDLPINFVEYAPSQIKLAVTGYGNAEKAQVQEAVRDTLGLEKIIRPDDASDAVGAALTAWYLGDIKERYPEPSGIQPA